MKVPLYVLRVEQLSNPAPWPPPSERAGLPDMPWRRSDAETRYRAAQRRAREGNARRRSVRIDGVER